MKKSNFFLIVIFVLTLSLRLYVAFSLPGFSSDESYYTLRQVEHISETGKPLIDDSLSFGGRTRIVLPVYYYLLAFFNLFMPLEIVAKIIPNIFASLLVFVAFFIGKEISKSNSGALFTALLSGFIPIFFIETVNGVSIHSFVLPLIFLILYLILRIHENEKFAVWFIILLFILIFTHGLAFLLILALLFYLVLVKIEYLDLKKQEIELILFAAFLYLWISSLFFKKAMLNQGLSVLSQNMPKFLVAQYFSQITILSALNQIGYFPIIAGVYVIYLNVWRKKKKSIWLFIGFTISSLLLLLFNFIRLKTGLMYLGAVIVLLFSYFYKAFFSYIKSTRLSKRTGTFHVFFFLLIIFTSVYTSLTYSLNLESIPSQDELGAINWIKNNTKESDKILWNIHRGNTLTYFTGRANVADSNFLLIDNSEKIMGDLNLMYRTPYITTAVRLFNEYNVDYIILSDLDRKAHNITQLPYYDKNCLAKVYNRKIDIYKSLCILE